MGTTTQPLLFDRDNLNEVFRVPEHSKLLEDSKYKNVKELCQALIANKAEGSEYIVGLPGAGKTTFAIHQMNAQVIEAQEDVLRILNMDFDKMVFVTSGIEDDIAQKAKHITLIHTSPERIELQRKERDEEIEEDESETAFGRSARSTASVTTDASILISRLKTDYENKSTINWDNRKNIPVSKLSERKKYVEEGVVAASGKWAPAQIVHIEHQLKRVLSLAEEKNLASYAIIGKNSGKEYDLGLTQHERIKIINLVLRGELQILTSGAPDFIKDKKGRVIKIIPGESYAVLGKERLPEGFTEGTYEDIVRDYPQFLKSQDAYAVKAFAGYNFINMGTIAMEGSEESVSATFVRRNLVEGNVDAVQPYLNPEIFDALTSPHNLEALQRRYMLIQTRNQKKEDIMEKYKRTDPITKKHLGKDSKGKAKNLTRTYAKKYDKDPAAKEKILHYIEKAEVKVDEIRKRVQKKYKNLIHTDKNKLELEK